MKKHEHLFKCYDLFRSVWMYIVFLFIAISPTNVLAGNANDGDGTMAVSPTAVCAGSTGNSFTFTFTKPNTGDFQSGSQATLVIPSAWTAPQNSTAGSPGYLSINVSGAGSAATIASISGTGPWTVAINFTLTANGSTFTLTYGGGGTAVTSPTAGVYTFTTQTKQNGGTLTNIVSQPVITSTAVPVATFSYTGTPYCKNASNPSPTFSGGGVAGTFSSTAGLVFVSTTTGQINLASSTAGTYTVTNTIAASGGCSAVTATSTIVITALPVATFSYSATPYCQSAANPSPTFSGSGVAGTFSSTAGLVFVSNSTGQVDLSASTPGTYTVTNTIAAANGCALVSATSPITITAVPSATISYAGTPFCKSVATAQSVTLSGTGAYTGGTYTSTLGLTISAATGAITPSSSTAGSYTVTYTIPASGGCAAIPVTTSATITAIPVATFSYAATPYCQSAANPSPTFSGGGVAGTFSSTAGLAFVSNSTGQVDLSASTPGTYTVTNTIAAANGCALVSATSPITITAVPSATISYAGTPFCKSVATAQSVTLSGTGAYTGGTYTSTLGLTISAATGAITPSSSTAGSYTVTYTIPASGGCAAIPVTTSATITAIPVATFSYAATPYCQSAANPSPTFSGGGVAGTFSSTAGLAFVSNSTGQVDLSASTPGTYTVTNTIAAANGCALVSATSPITITAVPSATISYAGTPFCKSVATAQAVTLSGTAAYTGGTYTSTLGLTISAATGAITPSSSTAGSYTVTYTIPASGGCAAIPVTTSATITAIPVATFSYAATPYCQSAANPSPTFSGGGVAGTFSSTAGLAFVSNSTGQVDLSASTPGTYTVTNTIAAANGCALVSATSPITITAVPSATISYAGTPFCKSVATAQSVTLSGTGAYTGGTYTSTLGLTISAATGAITPSSSTAGSYTVTYTIPASGGCAAIPVTTSATITAIPVATFSYAATPYCQSAANPSPTFSGGGVAGTFSSTAGLVFVSTSTGQVDLSASTPGTYTVTNTIAAANGCALVSATSPITITAVPSATISYAGTPFCKSVATAQSVTLSGTGTYTGGTYTSTLGLTISAATGAITPSSSTAGSYTVTYTIPASGGCAAIPVSTTVTITAIPTASISYAGTPFCKSIATAQGVTLSGTGAYTGGTFTSTAGLTIDGTTGAITPGSSTAGTYTITYTSPASGGCVAVSTTTSITITAVPSATISYAGTPFCKSVATAQAVTISGTGAYTGGAYSSTVGLSISAATGAITPSTSTAGIYTVTYTIPASGGCAAIPITTTVTITAIPVATFSYTGSPYSASGSDPLPTFSGGGIAGTFTSTAGLVFVSSSTGEVDLSASTPGTYTVTNTIAASGGCALVSATNTIVIISEYRSKISGNWNSASTWEVYNGSSWIAATSTPTSADGVIEIRQGHIVTVTTSVTADQLIIDTLGQVTISTGTLTINNGTGTDLSVTGFLDITSTVAMNAGASLDLTGSAILRNTGTLNMSSGAVININNNGVFRREGGSLPTASGFFIVNNGGKFQHAMDAGILPSATWNTGSTCEITGANLSEPTGLTQNFQNFIWNCAGQTGYLNFASNLQTILADFTMMNTGSGYIYLDAQGNNSSLTIGGNFYVKGGTTYFCVNGNTTVTLTNGDIIITGGNLNYDQAGGAAYGNESGVVYLNGNLTITGGTLDMSMSSANNPTKGIGALYISGNLTVAGTGAITETSSSAKGIIEFNGTTAIQYFVSSGNITNHIDYLVDPNAVLRMDTSVATGTGIFTLNSAAGLMMGHAGGITKTSMNGNVQCTGIRSYSTGADYTYNGTVLQVSGDGLPSLVRNLTLNNPSNCTLTASTSASGIMTFTTGIWIAQTDTLTLGTSTSNLGTLSYSSGHVYGYFRRWIGATATSNILFPVGSLSFYNGANFSFTMAPTAGSIVSTFINLYPGTSGLPITDAGETCVNVSAGYWRFGALNGFAGGIFNVNLFCNGYVAVYDYTKLHIFRRNDSTSPWTTNGTHAAGTGSNSAPVANRIGMNLLGEYGVTAPAVNPLPIELVDFTAKLVEQKVLINWKTSSEINNAYFTVERTSDGVNYTTVAKRNGAGNSTTINSYYAVDNNPLPGISYYRLTQTDNDGHETIFPTVAVTISIKGDIIIFPNPSRGSNIYIAFPNNFSGDVIIEVNDLAGKIIFSRNESPSGNSLIELDPKKLLHPGAYFVKIIMSNESFVQRIIITD